MENMLDTDTCIYAMKRAKGFTPKEPLENCIISVIVLGELESGVHRSAKPDASRAALSDLLAVLAVAPADEAVARAFGELRAHLFSKGQPIGPHDMWIASHALALDLPLVTNNTREFSRVPNLVIDTWMGNEP